MKPGPGGQILAMDENWQVYPNSDLSQQISIIVHVYSILGSETIILAYYMYLGYVCHLICQILRRCVKLLLNSWAKVLFSFCRNLQAAIGSYYDIEANLPVQRLPSMVFVKDVTIGEGESVPPCTEYTKTWRVRNPGKTIQGKKDLKQANAV